MHYFSYAAHALPLVSKEKQSFTRQTISNNLQMQFPPVDTKQLHDSAEKFQEIMREASLLIDKITNSPEFASRLMDEAQRSNKEEVEQLIKSTGVKVKVHTKYTPSGIQIELDSSSEKSGCCKLNMSLLW